jgi:hypothetical protein
MAFGDDPPITAKAFYLMGDIQTVDDPDKWIDLFGQMMGASGAYHGISAKSAEEARQIWMMGLGAFKASVSRT